MAFQKFSEEPSAPTFFAAEEAASTPSSTGQLASFSLLSAPTFDWQMRSDEQVMLEFELETEESQSAIKRYIACCTTFLTFLTLPFLGCACCIFAPAWKRANRLPNSRFFVTDRAVYYHLDSGYEAEIGCFGGQTHVMDNIRITFQDINLISDNMREFLSCGGSCWYCCSPPADYGFVSISNKTLVTVPHGKHHINRYQTAFVPLVRRHHDVIRLLLFLRDAATAGQAIDWDSIQRQMN